MKQYIFRKSYIQEDSLTVAQMLSKKFSIKPYNIKELADVVKAGVKAGEISIKKIGRTNVLFQIEEWFKDRLLPNTVSIPIEMYKRSLYSSFRLIILGNIAKTDFGSSRQRDFGQMLTDFTRGFLGEAAIKIFLKQQFGLKVDLEEKEIGDVKQFLPTDIIRVWAGSSPRVPKLNLSIKTSKLPSMWLDIARGQLSHSDIFCFIKIGLTVDHFAIFLKEAGFIQKLVEIGKEIGEVKANEVEKEINRLLSAIPVMLPWPAYISGYVTQNDLRSGKLLIQKRRSKSVVVGGCGYFGAVPASEVEGLGKIGKEKYLACLSALHWDQKSWKNIVKKI